MTIQHFALRLILITAALALASNLRAGEIFQDGFEGPCGPPAGFSIHPVAFETLTNNGEAWPGAGGLGIVTPVSQNRIIAASFFATDRIVLGSGVTYFFSDGKHENVPYAQNHHPKRLAISECPGEVRNVPPNCLFEGQQGVLYWTVAGTANACQLEVGKRYYMNIGFTDGAVSTCPSSKPSCISLMHPRYWD